MATRVAEADHSRMDVHNKEDGWSEEGEHRSGQAHHPDEPNEEGAGGEEERFEELLLSLDVLTDVKEIDGADAQNDPDTEKNRENLFGIANRAHAAPAV